VGPGSLKLIEELLGQPLPREGPRRTSPPVAPWPEHLWRKRGLQVEAAITFAQMDMSVARLKTMTREELLSLPGVGMGTLRACELIIGRALPSRTVDSTEVFWRRQGIEPRAARALSQAGIRSLADLRGATHEGLLALRGIGDVALAQMEACLGSEIPSRVAYWLDRGLDSGVARLLVREGIYTLDDFGKLTCQEFLSVRGLSFRVLGQCEALLGRRLPDLPRGKR
jgi:hypothetical protein